MKCIAALCAAFLCAHLLITCFPVHGEDQIYDNMIRLHVLANSDSGEDQARKLRVRDAVLAYLDTHLPETDSTKMPWPPSPITWRESGHAPGR